MTITQRPTPEQFTHATWEEILPLYQTLAAVELSSSDPVGIETWLSEWNALDVALGEASTTAQVANSIDTADPVKEEAYLRFTTAIGPKAAEQRVVLARKLIATGYSRPDLETSLRRMRTNEDLFREENVALEQEIQGLQARYGKITGGMTVQWRGTEVPIPRLSPFFLDPDRTTREEAWTLQFAPYIDNKEELDTLFDQQITLRQEVAKNAGFANYRDYTFESKFRYDYSPDDCFSFHAAVEQTFVPAIQKRQARRKELMGLDSLKPWDLTPDPLGRPALKPYTDIEDLNAKSEEIFRKVDPVFGDYFGIMRNEDLLDLESRKGKRPGGYCTGFPYRKRPFIFMNASGTAGDVRTLLHEAGHAFHGFESSANLPLLMQQRYGSEMAEVASMSMELLSAPYLHRKDGGLFEDGDFERGAIEHLEGVLDIFAWVATVDAFQHWIYTDADALDHAKRDAKWIEIWSRFSPGVDWDGLESERIARWQKQLHIFLYPFYYIEYAIAQLGALQVWRNALKDQAQATADYRAALALGGSKPLPDLFAAAGARLIFDAPGMAELVSLVEGRIAELEA
ncbi:MAG: M3 family oligoendopeptidase [Thermomicrobiales bacterium]